MGASSEGPAPQQRRSSRIGCALVAAALVLLGSVVLWLLSGLVHEPSGPTPCRRSLSGLGQLFINWRLERPETIPHNGPALFLWFRKKRYLREGEEEYLLCPGDLKARFPEAYGDRAVYNSIDLDDPASWPIGCLSYAVRDFERFPLDSPSGDVQIIAADRCGPLGRSPHHQNGLNVLFDNGSAKLMTWEKLGFPAKGPPPGTVIVGPESPNPMLSKLIVPR